MKALSKCSDCWSNNVKISGTGRWGIIRTKAKDQIRITNRHWRIQTSKYLYKSLNKYHFVVKILTDSLEIRKQTRTGFYVDHATLRETISEDRVMTLWDTSYSMNRQQSGFELLGIDFRPLKDKNIQKQI